MSAAATVNDTFVCHSTLVLLSPLILPSSSTHCALFQHSWRKWREGGSTPVFTQISYQFTGINRLKVFDRVHCYGLNLCVQFYRCFRAFLNCSTPKRDSTVKTFTRISLRAVGQDKQQKVSALAPSSARPTPNSIHESSRNGSHSTSSDGGAAAAKSPAANSSKPKLILVAHYRE